MLKIFLKTTIRSLRKNKGYSILNIFGLTIGIACAGFIFLWVEDEMHWDNTNVKKDRIYLARTNTTVDAGISTNWSTPGLLAPAIQAELPGISNTCRTSENETSLLFNIGDKSLYASGKYADPSLFNMFTLPFVQGNAKTAFLNLYSLVITEKTAKKFFGNDKDVIGKTVRTDNKQDYIIAGVLKDIPENSSLQFEWIAPFEIYFQQHDFLHNWQYNAISTYVELRPGIDAASANKQLYNFIQQKEPASITHPFLWSMNDWRLYDDFANGRPTGKGRIEYVRLFSIIAWIILLIACVNFMNLITAQGEKRAKEVGVRKVLGAAKKSLIIQYMGEALFMAMLAALSAIIIMMFALPSFNTLVQKNLMLDIGNPAHIVALLLIVLVCGFVAGSYPSLYLSSFNPINVLKGLKIKTGGATIIRKGLVVLQFTISVVFIISTIIIYLQIQHVKNRNLGFNKNNLIEIKAQGDIGKNFIAIKQDLINTGAIENIGLSNYSTINSGNNTNGLTWQGKPAGTKTLISTRFVTPEFINTSGIKLIEGRNLEFSDTVKSKTMNVLITQSLEKLMGKESAIGKIILPEGAASGFNATVVGVVGDYVYGDMYGKSDPVLFGCISPGNANEMYIRIKAQTSTEQALAKIQAVMKKDNPVYPFEYQFVDDQFNAKFLSETLISKLSKVFAALAIIISCLGLFGLAAYTAERRIKEIGVRKVLGASVSGIAALLSKDFLKLVGISCLIAFPVAWWLMNDWLQSYQYRIEISWWIFLIAGLAAIMIALITVSFHAIKAAVANPVKSLRTE